jgi:small GTP-binding protein
MGSFLSSLLALFNSNRKAKICIVGLPAAGKTSITLKLKGIPLAETQPPTLGSNVETMTRNNITLECWDLGGQESLREMWSVYFSNTEGVVLVIDSADKAAFPIVAIELDKLLQNEDLKGIPLLILANKQDLPGAAEIHEITKALRLDEIRDRPFHIQLSCAKSGQGLDVGFDWLSSKILER